MLKKEWNKFVEKYEAEYERSIKERIKEIPMMMKVFERIDDEIYNLSNKIYNMTKDIQDKIEEELYKKLTKRQKDLIEKIMFCEDIMRYELVEIAFIYGYSLSTSLIEESKYIVNKELKKH